MKKIINVGDTITIPAFRKFKEEKITCVKITHTNDIIGDLYEFDSGLKLHTYELLNNIDLWNSRR
jgi:hypothetical protein